MAIKKSLHPWDKSHLMVYDPFSVLLDLLSFTRLRKFSAFSFSNMLQPFSLFFFWNPYHKNISELDIVLEVS